MVSNSRASGLRLALCVCIGTVEPFFIYFCLLFCGHSLFFLQKNNMQKRAIPTPPLAQQIIKYRLKVQNLPPVPTVHVGIHNVVKALYLLVFSCSISIYLTSTIPSIFFKCWRPVSSSPASSNNKQQSTTKQTNVEIGPQVIGFIPHTQMNVRSGGTEKCAPPCFLLFKG